MLIVLPGTRYAAKRPFEGRWRLVECQRTAKPGRDRLGQRALAAVSTITESLSASRECRFGGMTSRSPLRPSQLVLPALHSTCPLSTMIVASPGLLCSVSPLLYRYPPGRDGLPGTEGAFLPLLFLACPSPPPHRTPLRSRRTVRGAARARQRPRPVRRRDGPRNESPSRQLPTGPDARRAHPSRTRAPRHP